MSDADFAIRPFEPADRASLEKLWADAFTNDPPWNEPSDMIERKLRVQPELLLVGVVEGELMSAVMAGYDGVRGWIYHLAVAPEFRRRGFATKLVHAAESRLRELGCPKVNIQIRASNDAVVAFYRSLGYNAEDHLSMGRLIDNE